MIISDEQIQLAMAYLRESGRSDTCAMAELPPGISTEFIERLKRELAERPDTCIQRVEHGRVLALSGVSAEKVAEKIIGRMISDSIR